jgi:hypothetical protein
LFLDKNYDRSGSKDWRIYLSKSRKPNMIEKNNALRSFVKEDLGDVKEYYIFRTNNIEGEEQFGVIMPSQDVEHLDEHCDKCRDEILGFRIPGPEEVPNYLWVFKHFNIKI